VSQYCIIFHRAEDKFQIVEGIPCIDTKSVKPISFQTIEEAEDYIISRTKAAISREYNCAVVHELQGREAGRPVAAYELGWRRLRGDFSSSSLIRNL